LLVAWELMDPIVLMPDTLITKAGGGAALHRVASGRGRWKPGSIARIGTGWGSSR
jgi:hypothetical protein